MVLMKTIMKTITLNLHRALRAGILVTATLLLAACASPEERAAGYLKRADELYAAGDYVKAKLEAQNAAQIEPKNARAHFLLALIAEQQQEFRPMVQRLQMAVDADPNMVAARVKLGGLYFFGQAFDLAAEQAKAAAALAPDDPEVHVLQARLFLQDKKQEEGVRELDAALAKSPDMAEALLLRAAAEAVTDPAAGIRMLDEAIGRLDKEKAKQLRQVRIAILAQQNRSADVEQGFRDLIKDFPKDEEYQYQLARFYASQGRVDDAEEVMRSAAAVDPEDVNARLGLAQFLLQLRSPEAAEKALEAFVAENPNQPEIRGALGRLYEASGKPDAALAVYEELAKRDPKSKPGLAARVRVAALRIGKGDTTAGQQLVDAVLTDEPDNADGLLLRAGLRVRDRKFDDAVADVRTVLRKEPQNTRAMLLLARTHALMEDRVLAKDAYRRLLGTEPKSAEAAHELAVLEALDKNLPGAEDVLREHLKAAPDNLDSATRLIELLGAQKAWGKAEAEAKRVAALENDQGLGQLQLARLYQAQQKTAEAVEAYRTALAKNPQLVVALAGLNTVLNQTGKPEAALAEIDAFLKANPDNDSAKFLRGGALARRGDTKTAAQIYQDIVQQKPEASMVWAALANLNRDDPAARIDAYKRGLAVNAGNAELGLLLGTEYEQARRYDEAISHYEVLLKANPAIDVAKNNLASLLLDYRNDAASHARALGLAKELQGSDHPAILDTVGWAYYRNQDYPQAVQYLERAVAGAGQVPLLRYHLGMAYLASKNTVGAKQELKLAVSGAKAEYPGLAEAKAELSKLGG
jgi:tetratricopeptide (TPR) repeat protein